MGNFAFVLLFGFAMIIGAWVALEVRLLLMEDSPPQTAAFLMRADKAGLSAALASKAY